MFSKVWLLVSTNKPNQKYHEYPVFIQSLKFRRLGSWPQGKCGVGAWVRNVTTDRGCRPFSRFVLRLFRRVSILSVTGTFTLLSVRTLSICFPCPGTSQLCPDFYRRDGLKRYLSSERVERSRSDRPRPQSLITGNTGLVLSTSFSLDPFLFILSHSASS